MRFSTPLLPIAAIFFSAHVAAGFVDARTPSVLPAPPVSIHEGGGHKSSNEAYLGDGDGNGEGVSAVADKPQNNPLVLIPGVRLSHALKLWLGERHIRMSWEVNGSAPGLVRDFEVDAPWTSLGSDLKQVLTDVLGPFGLVAEIERLNRLDEGIKDSVIIRSAPLMRP